MLKWAAVYLTRLSIGGAGDQVYGKQFVSHVVDCGRSLRCSPYQVIWNTKYENCLGALFHTFVTEACLGTFPIALNSKYARAKYGNKS